MNRGRSGVNLPALRSHNAALVLDLLRVAGQGGISRLELAERTGLTPQAVSKIITRLREDGLVAEAGRRASTGGKPRTVLRLVRGAGGAVGLHLDRDELTAVLTDLTGEPIAVRTAAFDLGAAAEAVIATAVDQARALLRAAPGPVLGVGVACPGPLDHRTGVLGRVTGMPQWDGFPLRDALAARLALPVVLDKDTNAAALGIALRREADTGDDAVPEAAKAGGQRAPLVLPAAESFAYLHLGTGLGAGLVLGGGLYRGSRTGAGEFGHQVIQLDGPPCACGGRGCLEALCLSAVARGNTEEAARVLGTGAANLAGLLDIDRVLLGGRTAVASPGAFVRGVGAALDGRAAARRVPVAVVPSGARAVAYGAAYLVLAPLFGRAEPIAGPEPRAQEPGAQGPGAQEPVARGPGAAESRVAEPGAAQSRVAEPGAATPSERQGPTPSDKPIIR